MSVLLFGAILLDVKWYVKDSRVVWYAVCERGLMRLVKDRRVVWYAKEG